MTKFNKDLFDEEDFPEFGSDFDEELEPEIEDELELEPEVEVVKKNQNDSKVVVMVNRVHIYKEPNVLRGTHTAVVRGNMLNLIETVDSEWVEVELPRTGDPIRGFVPSIAVRPV